MSHLEQGSCLWLNLSLILLNILLKAPLDVGEHKCHVTSVEAFSKEIASNSALTNTGNWWSSLS